MGLTNVNPILTVYSRYKQLHVFSHRDDQTLMLLTNYSNYPSWYSYMSDRARWLLKHEYDSWMVGRFIIGNVGLITNDYP